MKILLSFLMCLIASITFADNGFWNETSTIKSVGVTGKHAKKVSINKQMINLSGSSTVSNVLNLLADRFEEQHKNIKISISGGGSSSAVLAMLANSDSIGQMSRAMKKKERDAFVKHYGYEPIEFKIAVDALAVYVNKNNPIKELTKNQLINVFSDSRQHVDHWGDLDLQVVNNDRWKKQVIQVFTLPKIAGAYSLFNKRMLKQGGYKISTISEPTSSSVVQSVGVNPGGITFASSFFRTKRTRFVALEAEDGQLYMPVQPWISSFKYPISRYLYLYINKKPGTELSVKHKQFFKFLMADGTQLLIKRAGFYSVSDEIRKQQIDMLK